MSQIATGVAHAFLSATEFMISEAKAKRSRRKDKWLGANRLCSSSKTYRSAKTNTAPASWPAGTEIAEGGLFIQGGNQ
jgi:hypothetical protein